VPQRSFEGFLANWRAAISQRHLRGYRGLHKSSETARCKTPRGPPCPLGGGIFADGRSEPPESLSGRLISPGGSRPPRLRATPPTRRWGC